MRRKANENSYDKNKLHGTAELRIEIISGSACAAVFYVAETAKIW